MINHIKCGQCINNFSKMFIFVSTDGLLWRKWWLIDGRQPKKCSYQVCSFKQTFLYGSKQRTLGVLGITQYHWVPANLCCFPKHKFCCGYLGRPICNQKISLSVVLCNTRYVQSVLWILKVFEVEFVMLLRTPIKLFLTQLLMTQNNFYYAIQKVPLKA